MAAATREIKSPCDNKVQLLKWKVRKNSMVSKGSILALYSTSPDEAQVTPAKLKAAETGTVVQLVAEEGEIIAPFGTMLLLQPQTDGVCSHPTIMKDMCADCGADLRKELGSAGDRKQTVSASVAMVHNIPELIVSQEQAMELGREDENRLLRERKLVLLVDLDQTLIHTTNDNIPPNLKDVKHFQLWHGKSYMWYHTRFRPFTEQFLQAVSKMYELHICTFGVRMYAHIIARLLDPNEKYFSHRILSRDECFDNLSKTANLKALFPCGDTMVGIIDDREDVWNFAPNLVHVKPYRFFQGTADINAPPGLTKSENDDIPVKHKCVDQKKKASYTSDHSVEENEVDKAGDNEARDSADNGNDSCKKSEEIIGAGYDNNETGDKGNGKSEEPPKQDTSLADSHAEEDKKDEENDSVSKDDHSKADDENQSADKKEVKASADKTTSDLCAEGQKDDQISEDQEGGEKREKEDAESHCIGESAVMEGEDGGKERDTVEDKGRESAVEDKGMDCTVENKGIESTVEEDKSQTDETKDNKEEIEWEDTDDYLLHLEEILRRIHTAYYDMYEQSQKSGSNQLPDLKNIIPYVRKKVLKGTNIVFSGMFPLNMPMERSRAYITAKALGANVQLDIVPNKSTKLGRNPEATTHLVAAKLGTGKYKSALKAKGVHVVSGDWLWACAERWELVDERLYSLTVKKNENNGEDGGKGDPSSRGSRKRKKPAASAENEDDAKLDMEEDGRLGEDSQQGVKKSKNSDSSSKVNSSRDDVSSTAQGDAADHPTEFSSSYNPLLSFSDQDIEQMDKEVDEIMAEDNNDSSDESDDERDSRLRKEVLGQSSADSDSDSDSLAGDFPRGWKMRRKSFSPPHSDHGSDRGRQTDEEVVDEESENELERYQKTVEAFSPRDSDSDSDSNDDSIGSVDDEMAEAVEKEFLSSL